MAGWGTPEQLIDPVVASELFFDQLAKIDNWQNMPPWAAAQRVQDSPDSGGQLYQDTFARAGAVVSALTAAGAAPFTDPVCLQTGLRKPAAVWPPAGLDS